MFKDSFLTLDLFKVGVFFRADRFLFFLTHLSSAIAGPPHLRVAIV